MKKSYRNIAAYGLMCLSLLSATGCNFSSIKAEETSAASGNTSGRALLRARRAFRLRADDEIIPLTRPLLNAFSPEVFHLIQLGVAVS